MRSIGVTLGLLALAAASALFCARQRSGVRSAGPVQTAAALSAPEAFSRAEAAGLFVGVSDFVHDPSLTVPYAVDDAIDLAHRFSLDQRVALIPARNIVLALSGAPQKDESKARLQELTDAGAKVERATAGDILQLLKAQAARTGKGGLLVLSLATHGFQQSGDAYILGSTSAFGAPETSLRTATLLDVAARAPRSLIFVDACRDRIGTTSRGATPDPAAAAPQLRRMSRVRGQIIFYAAAPGEYAFDDPVHRNGVFTRAVLDGLDCEATAPRGMVVAESLHTYVEREVRRWIQTNRSRTVNPATQISMEGQTRNMPLCRCWMPPGRRLRAAFDGSVLTAYGENSEPLWRHDLRQPIRHAATADLDADGFSEVVIAVPDRLIVLDRDGRRRWERRGKLHAFTTGDLFEKKTNQIVALWYEAAVSTSRMTILDSEGLELSTFDHAGELQHVAVARPTNMHAPKIVVTSRTELLVLKPRRKGAPSLLWRRSVTSGTIHALRIADADHDTRRDIAIVTGNGTLWFTFEGTPVRRGRSLPPAKKISDILATPLSRPLDRGEALIHFACYDLGISRWGD